MKPSVSTTPPCVKNRIILTALCAGADILRDKGFADAALNFYTDSWAGIVTAGTVPERSWGGFTF